MTTQDKPVELDLIACEICLKEVPISEATVPEATDYVVHFCGVECYQKWKRQADAPEDPGNAPAP
ncbi:DUF3330 domain-containing protein [Rhodoferax sp.]|uniref:DUF3330 domain-containing protein n=1 Tax=Rhodoferax sp. TaxID=50421 RepID=UPI0027662D37|nr:DUF3330 domain-containing protein [Rhodoferax sp.]